MTPSGAVRRWVEAVTGPYCAPDKHLDLFTQGTNGAVDFGPLRFGGLYRCRQSFRANGTGHAMAGEEFRFLGCDVFPHDGVHRLFFRDQDGERIFEFVDIYPETDGRTCGRSRRLFRTDGRSHRQERGIG